MSKWVKRVLSVVLAMTLCSGLVTLGAVTAGAAAAVEKIPHITVVVPNTNDLQITFTNVASLYKDHGIQVDYVPEGDAGTPYNPNGNGGKEFTWGAVNFFCYDDTTIQFNKDVEILVRRPPEYVDQYVTFTAGKIIPYSTWFSGENYLELFDSSNEHLFKAPSSFIKLRGESFYNIIFDSVDLLDRPWVMSGTSPIRNIDTFPLLFSKSAKVYNHTLALLGVDWSDFAYNKASKPQLRNELEKNGFINVDHMNSYDDDIRNIKGNHYVAYTFARQTVPINGKQTDLIAIVVRGTQGAEWYSNFDVHDPDKPLVNSLVHYGFQQAYEDLNKKLEEYLGRYYNLSTVYKNVKFFVTGHSRGAAVANILAKELSIRSGEDNVFAYTFATPNVDTNAGVSITSVGSTPSTQYSNIFNFVNMEDMVPYMPLRAWEYRRYGQSIALNTDDNAGLITAAAAKFKELTGEDYQSWSYYTMEYAGFYELYGADALPGGLHIKSGLIDKLAKKVPSATEYYTTVISPTTKTRTSYLWFYDELAAFKAGHKEAGDINAQLNEGLTWGLYLINNSDKLDHAHRLEAYKAWLLTYGPGVVNRTVPKWVSASIRCPVDVEVYNSSNELVGKVVNNEINEEATRGIAVSVDGDYKNFLMPSGHAYTFKITATDNGKMDYIVQSIDAATGEVMDIKTFTNVALTPGKTFTSAVGDTTITPNVQLLVTNTTDNGTGNEGTPTAIVNTDGTETPIVQKQYFRLWGKTTMWEKNFWNWVLLIVCFGWVWMAF